MFINENNYEIDVLHSCNIHICIYTQYMCIYTYFLPIYLNI